MIRFGMHAGCVRAQGFRLGSPGGRFSAWMHAGCVRAQGFSSRLARRAILGLDARRMRARPGGSPRLARRAILGLDARRMRARPGVSPRLAWRAILGLDARRMRARPGVSPRLAWRAMLGLDARGMRARPGFFASPGGRCLAWMHAGCARPGYQTRPATWGSFSSVTEARGNFKIKVAPVPGPLLSAHI